jgi:hypothetical protein
LSISRRKRLLTSSSLLFLFLSFNVFAQLTYPPSPDDLLEPGKLLSAARGSFLKGDLAGSYKYLLLSENLKTDQNCRDLFFLTLVGLDKPVDAASFLLELKNPSADESLKLELLSKRQGFTRAYSSFKPDTPPISIPKETAKKAAAVARGGDLFFVLTPLNLYGFSSSGKLISTLSLTNGRELIESPGERPFVLTSNSIITPSGTITLPLKIGDALSFARAPGDCYYVLDSAGRVFLLSGSGAILEERQILIKKPVKIRTDELSRIFILSGQENDISVYSASFSPLFVLSPETQGASTGRAGDFQLDFAGDPLILDKSRKELLLFNFTKHFLGKSSNKSLSADAFSWDGGNGLTVLDKKKGVIMKVLL